MLHELLAYFAGTLMLFALSSKGLFITVLIVAFLSAIVVWWGCGWFGRLWYIKFNRKILHWFMTVFASAGTFLFVLLIAASAYAPQISMISALVWRTQLTFDESWGEAVLRKTYDAVKDGGFEKEGRFVPFGEGPIPVDHDESKRIAAEVEAEEAHLHFRQHRPLLSRVFWNDPKEGAQKVFQHMESHFGGGAGETAGQAADAVLVDITKTLPNWEEFLAELDATASAQGLLASLLKGVGITPGLERKMEKFDRTLEVIEADEKKVQSTSDPSMHYAILANEILTETIENADRTRKVLIFSLIGLFLLFLLIPFGTIGMAARREADLSRNQAPQY